MPEKDTMICYCHNCTLGEIAKYIKENGTTDYKQIVENPDYPCGNSCRSCHKEGYQNDGFSLAMVVLVW